MSESIFGKCVILNNKKYKVVEPLNNKNGFISLRNMITGEYLKKHDSIFGEFPGLKVNTTKKVFKYYVVDGSFLNLFYVSNNDTYSLFTKGEKTSISLTEKSNYQYMSVDLQLQIDSCMDKIQVLNESIDKLTSIILYNNPITNVPPAVGPARDFQLKCLHVLIEFDKICRQLGIEYWLTSGCLLGALRHGGFIPWDDDIDVGMMYDDFIKLKEFFVLHNQFADPEFLNRNKKILKSDFSQIDVNNLYLQNFFPASYKLKSSLFENPNPLVEIFVFYHKPNDVNDKEFLSKFKNLRSVSKKILVNDPNNRVIYRDFVEKGLSEISSKTPGEAVFLGLQTSSGRYLERLYNDIFPTTEILFEGRKFLAPRRYFNLLKNDYGNFYEYPVISKHFVV